MHAAAFGKLEHHGHRSQSPANSSLITGISQFHIRKLIVKTTDNQWSKARTSHVVTMPGCSRLCDPSGLLAELTKLDHV
jgi:hypothetical protein